MMLKINMAEIIDIVSLVQNNPLTRLSSDYGSKIIQKIQDKFNTEDQQLFVVNYYCYLNCDQKNDFVINLDRIWKWLGYTRVDHCKTVLIKNFKENQDYKIEKAAPEVAGVGPKISIEGKNLGGAGHNREYITLTVNCFKKLCLKSRTEKADQIHDYYIELENILNEVVSEQTDELKQRLKNKEIENTDLKQKTLIEAYKNKPIVYLAQVQSGIDGIIIKFGYTNDISDRIVRHRSIFSEFKLLYCIETIYNRELELLIKLNLKKYIIAQTFSNTKQTELIKIDNDMTMPKLQKLINEYKVELHSGEIMKKIIEENDRLKNELEHIKNTNSSDLVVKLNFENDGLKKEIETLQEQLILTKEDEQDKGDCLYIWHNQVVKNAYKIGITDLDTTKDPKYIFTYNSNNAKLIKQMMRILLKSSLHVSKKYYNIEYVDIKYVFDFCVMMYDEYMINNNTQCAIDFISRYNRHRLTVNSKTREMIGKEVYKDFLSEHLIYGNNYKIPLIFLSDKFYEWYLLKYGKDNGHIKINGNYSTVFRKEFIKNIQDITKIEIKDINIVTKQLYYHGYAGFTGFTTADFEEKLKEDNSFYDQNTYIDYIEKFMIVTNNERHKVSKKELLEDFKQYATKNNIYNQKTFKKIWSPKYVNEFMKVVENKTGLKYESDRTKKDDKGCFVGLEHKNFDCLVNTSMKDNIKDDKQYKKETRLKNNN